MRNKVLVLVAVMLSSVYSYVTGYHVEPVKAAWSGWTAFQGGVSQVITCNFDEFDSASAGYVELFAGEYGQGGAYNLAVTDYVSGQPVASQTGVLPGRDHAWLRFGGITMEPGRAFTKGKKYEFRFTRSGTDSIHYYYDTACGYDYGQMIAPYPPSIAPSYGLAMRVYGRM